MNLKDAFRYERVLTRLFHEGLHSMEARPTMVFYHHRRSAARPGQPDETTREKNCVDGLNNDLLLDFLLFLLQQKRLLGEAIRNAKREEAGIIDAEMQINAMRRRLYDTLRQMLSHKNDVTCRFGEGVGYYLDGDGTQREYHYDIEELTTVNFDREHFGKKATELIRQAENVSSWLERQLLRVEVTYDPPFEVYCQLTDAVERFAAGRKAAG